MKPAIRRASVLLVSTSTSWSLVSASLVVTFVLNATDDLFVPNVTLPTCIKSQETAFTVAKVALNARFKTTNWKQTLFLEYALPNLFANFVIEPLCISTMEAASTVIQTVPHAQVRLNLNAKLALISASIMTKEPADCVVPTVRHAQRMTIAPPVKRATCTELEISVKLVM